MSGETYPNTDALLKFLREHLLDGDLTPSETNSHSIGSSSLKLKDIFIDGRAYIDAFTCPNVITKTANYTVTVNDHVILADTSGGAFTVTLPKVADSKGLMLVFVRTGAGINALTIDGDGAETINGGATNAEMDAQYDMLTLYCDGTEWFIISRYIH